MAGDLGAGGSQVHEKAREVLDFWFDLSTERQFAKDEALDREIDERFGGMRVAVVRTRAADWRGEPDALLAAIILVDQFSRNLFRGDAEAFAHDDLAAELTLLAIERGWDDRYAPERRAFLYMPLMHAEEAGLQRLSVAKFAALGREHNLAFARDHAEVFERFGRFPSRNAALGRETTAEEQAWLDAGGGW